MNNLISCIITTYKRPIITLKRAIDSIYAQTYKNIEIILVNDYPNGKDLCEQIINLVTEYNNTKDIKINYIIHKQNQGACAARNTGINNAHGKYIAFLDDDDEWLPTKLEEQLKLFEPDVGLVYCDNYIINNKGKYYHSAKTKLYKNSAFYSLLINNFIGSTSFPLIKTDIIKQAECFDVNMPMAQDQDMWIRIAKIAKIAYCPKPLINYYISETSITVTNGKKEFVAIQNKYISYYKSDKKMYCKYLCRMFCGYLILGNFKLMYKTLAKAVAANPISIEPLLFFFKGVCLYIRRRILYY